jgi:hypothetical protein
VIYFSACFGTAFIYEICNLIANEIDLNVGTDLIYSSEIFQIVLKFVSISIVIATAIIVVMKLCNKTLREHDDGRASRESTIDKYETVET